MGEGEPGRDQRVVLRRRLAPQRRLLRQVVPDRGGGDASLSHCVADLIQTDHDIACGVEPRYRRPLVRIDLDGTIFGEGINAARLAPASMTRILRRKRAR